MFAYYFLNHVKHDVDIMHCFVLHHLHFIVLNAVDPYCYYYYWTRN